MLEKKIEGRLVSEAKKRGCIPVKLLSASYNGLPDRMILAPGERVAFVELKRPGEEPRSLQLHRHKQLKALGFRVYVIDDMEQIGGVMDEIYPT